MEHLTKLFVTCGERLYRFNRGQTMTEYALIAAAVAIAVFVALTVTGTDINTMVSWTQIDRDLLGT